MKVKQRQNDDQMVCPLCHGTGEYLESACPGCGGAGWYPPGDAEAYRLALAVVEWIDDNLQSGREHFRCSKTTRLLQTLDDVCRAIADGGVVLGGNVKR